MTTDSISAKATSVEAWSTWTRVLTSIYLSLLYRSEGFQDVPFKVGAIGEHPNLGNKNYV